MSTQCLPWAMLLGDAAIPDASALRTHAVESVRMFLAAYGAARPTSTPITPHYDLPE
ncbi:TetR/AcrR family transcriptional regulator C-terminal domain-containing protein [Rhizobium pisi]|uniref:TetR/AcrR family transcriptional regulator C-terminal domain-containing protein n=1 Tax=Rhizobium pisi TaxID=574561 RepID=UPI0039AF1420